MKKLLFACAALLFAFAPISALAAADVTGAWTGAMGGGDAGGMQLTFNLKQDGTKLTGSVLTGQGDPIAITDGKIDGDKVSFKVVIQGGMTILHEGTLNAAGDQIKLTTKSDGGDFPGGDMTLTRAKAPPTN